MWDEGNWAELIILAAIGTSHESSEIDPRARRKHEAAGTWDRLTLQVPKTAANPGCRGGCGSVP